MVELHILLCFINIDGAWLHRHQVGAEDHLTEVVIVHVLHASLLLCAINVDTLVLFVDLIDDFTTDCASGEKFMMESMLFLVVLEHLLIYASLVVVSDFSRRN